MSDDKRNAEGFAISDFAPARNQCDGCARGLPLDKDGFHHEHEPVLRSWLRTPCTANTGREDSTAHDLALIRAGLEAAKSACVLESLMDDTGTESDKAYNRAVRDCVDAVDALSPEQILSKVKNHDAHN